MYRSTKLKKEDGEFTFGIPRLKKILQQLSSGEWMIKIEEYKNDRTLRQNSYYWKVLSIIGEELGYYKNELHEVFLDQFAPIQTIRNLEGKPIQKPVRTSQMTVEQMTAYIEQIIQFAAENNIVIPNPE